MEITFQVIETLLAIKKYNSITKVAQVMNISEPALSKQIKKFEFDLGYPLLVRKSSGCVLTKTGNLIAEKGLELLHMRDSLLNDIEETGKAENAVQKTLRFGLANCYAEAILNKFLPEFVSKYPNIKVELSINTTDTLEKMCIDNELDIILTQKEYCDSRLTCTNVCKEETVVYMPKKYENDSNLKQYAILGSIPLKALESYPMAEGQGHARFQSFTKQYYLEVDFHPNIIFRSDSWPTIVSLIKDKMCYSVMPNIFEDKEDDILKLHILSKYPTCRTLALAYKARNTLPVEWTNFIEIVKKNVCF